MSSYTSSVFIKRDATTCPKDSFTNVPTDGCKYVADIAKCASSECKWNVPPSKVRLYLLLPNQEEVLALRGKCLDSRLTLQEANIRNCGSSLIAELVEDDPPLARAADGKSRARFLPLLCAPPALCLTSARLGGVLPFLSHANIQTWCYVSASVSALVRESDRSSEDGAAIAERPRESFAFSLARSRPSPSLVCYRF
jgi:hypothetical protein